MKLATFTRGNGSELGAVVADEIFPLKEMPGAPDTMIALISQWDDWVAPIHAFITSTNTSIATNAVTLLAPIARPGKILAIGLNYADHVAESGHELPKEQVWFCKHTTSVNGPFAPVEVPAVSDKIDYEVELVAVIGKKGRHISVENAPDHVFGYCVGNDISTRDWQIATPQWMLGKSFDTHGPFGPVITTADEICDPHRLRITCALNGEIRQDSNTKNLIFSVWDQIAHLSKAMTLEPGDLIFTGTPGGIGALAKPPRFLRAGDIVRCEIEELGAIENLFEDEELPTQ
ncbi:fumarylacetoacetate hydrolase family protein [Pseudomonas gingeri]|uniref:Fumarylacetoacetate hydrolase family protein n=1 Tax=Pseudomonas gingeri TaxID=117681 RepID=A0A7Y7XBT8_9PSED|nr:fumarylacetoacetate hydrolase family protein [Pseudomonas gingeri]NWB97019.1 fumarylacetoacetate hydrolase family protein [Pseudomonas gingeri]